jgi:hypothetical protein
MHTESYLSGLKFLLYMFSFELRSSYLQGRHFFFQYWDLNSEPIP